MGKDILLLLISKYLKGRHSRLARLLKSEKHLENETAIEILPSNVFGWDYEGA